MSITSPAAIVLVHGAWHGAWCWRRVLPRLRGAGVETHAVTLTGVGDRLQRERPGTLAHMVYLDASAPYPGDSWSSVHTSETQLARLAAAQPSGGLSFPPPDAALFGLEGVDRDWVSRRQTPQPFRLYQQALPFDADRVAALSRTFIDCTRPALPTIAAARARVRSEPCWKVLEMATGHDPMVSEPAALAELLLGIQREVN